MVLPLWRSLHSVNLMLPKEDRRAMLLRIFNDEPQLLNITQGGTPQASTPITTNEEDLSGMAPTAEEENALKEENLVVGEDQQEQVDARETWTKAGDEDDRFNTTV
jgi:multisite-specific tRNA:(cytosine-C5)-methyltransferase